MRTLISALVLLGMIEQGRSQWISGGLFSVFNHFQAAAFHSPDTGIFVYGSDNPISGEGGMIVTYDGDQGGGFYLWYESSMILEDIHVVESNGFPYYMAAGSQQNIYSVIVKPYILFQNPFQFDSVRTGVGQYYRTVRMRTDLVAFAGGGNGIGDGVIDMSVDTGATWSNIDVLPGQPISRIRFYDDVMGFATSGGYKRLINSGILLPDSGAIYRTQDGGLSWQQVYSDAHTGFSDVAFSSPTNGIASRNDGHIFRTVDGGDNWTQSTMNYTDSVVLTSVTYRPDGVGFAGGHKTDGSEGVILISADGGGTWDIDFSTASLNHARRVYGITFANTATGYVSAHIRPLKSNGISTGVDHADDMLLHMHPNPATSSVFLNWPSCNRRTIEVIDCSGKVVLRRESSHGYTYDLDVSALGSGHYAVRSTSLKQTSHRALLIQR